MVGKPTPEELERRREELRQKAIASFPYARVQVPGDQALATWTHIGASGQGSPVVVGDDEMLFRHAETVSERPGVVKRTPAQILEVAAPLHHPDDLMSRRSRELEAINAKLRERRPEMAPLEMRRPRVGDWPTMAPRSPELSVAFGLRTRAPLVVTHVVTVPTNDWTTIPAYLHWGGWNGCPAPEYHIAALRSWRDRFGAELVGLGADVMNIRVQRRPETREAAFDLAREQYLYCEDIIDQGVETLSALAAMLMESDWWFFWWD